jgi:Raf kinase inhibitor-like YbhB/YbcL family protein
MGLVVTLGSTASLAAGTLQISSPSFQPNATLPSSATCEGEGRSPELQFSGVPTAAKSLVLIVFDPDVPRALKSDGRYLHWAVWDLPPDAGTIANASRGRSLNENGGGGYIPACPPNGEHRYVFQLFALDTTLGNTRVTNEADLRRAMEGHVLDQTELVGRYTTRMSRIITIVLGAAVLLIAMFLIRRIIARRRAAAQTSNL